MKFFWLLLGFVSCELFSAESPDLRKRKTESYLVSKKVPVNPFLPVIEGSHEARFRTSQDVAKRIIVLYNLSAFGRGADRGKVVERLKAANVLDHLSAAEKVFLDAKSSTQQQRMRAAWRIEAVLPLLWSLGKVDALDFPVATCDVNALSALIPDSKDSAEFIRTAKLRKPDILLDQVDLVYRTHWAVRDAQLNGRPVPAGLLWGVVAERHHALNWLTGYVEDWDDVSTDT